MSNHRQDIGEVRPFRWGELEFEETEGEQVFGEGFPGPSEVPAEEPPEESIEEQAERLLSAARNEADALLAGARAEVEVLREQARQEGWEQGRREALADVEARAAQVQQLTEQLANYKPMLYQEAREQVVELLLALLRKLIGPVMETHPEAVVKVVEHALQLLSDRENLTIRVHPSELKLLIDAKPKLLEAFDGIQRLTVLEDPAVKPGGCLVQTPTTEIDARMETQLQEIARLIRNP